MPALVSPADIDEKPLKGELPRELAVRLAREKALAARAACGMEGGGAFILAADTVVACGRRILPKAETEAQARDCLSLLSGRRHHVYGGICLILPSGAILTRLCDTAVKFKTLSADEKAAYLAGGEWQGKAGGYAIQGLAAAYIPFIRGSYSNVVGLSVHDTVQLLAGNGFFR